MKKRLFIIGIMLLALAPMIQPASAAQPAKFVVRDGSVLRVNGNQFRFAGTNNYYLMYKSQFMVDDVLNAAAANDFRVVRMWGSLDIGNQDGSNSISGKADGVYFQYWDGTAPAYNDGADGLQHLDYVVYKAKQLGLRLVIPFVNNWSAFGGIDQYVRWLNGQYHDQFYTDPAIRGWYKAWIAHLLNHTNMYTGVQYKNDPTIMTWELANEPRCVGSGNYPRSNSCTTQTLINWAGEMSTYIKSLDSNHLVSVGDEGFYCISGAQDWTENCGEGVDTVAFTQLANIDVMSYHLYPDSWGKTPAWGTQWITRHVADAAALNKPVMLGEFGLLDKSTRNPVYKEWTDAFFDAGGSGALYWILSGRQDDGTLYADYDGFTVYASNPVFITLGNFAQMMNINSRKSFAPVADNDRAVTDFETATTLNPAANDIVYDLPLNTASIDLDVTVPGQQTTKTVAGGTFALQSNGTVSFTPAAGFSGNVQNAYLIRDTSGRKSNAAQISVTVRPNPTAPITLFSFETGTEGWAPGNWQSNAGSVQQSSTFHTDGNYGLQVNTADGGWFGAAINPAADLSGKTHLKYDLQTVGAGTSTSVALQLGSGYTWCQSSWGWVNAGTTTTVDIDLLNLGCPGVNLNDVRGIFIWFSGGGMFYADYIRGE